jgi:hypothetical protein
MLAGSGVNVMAFSIGRFPLARSLSGLVPCLGAGLAVMAAGWSVSAEAPPRPEALKPASAFAGIADERQRSLALFKEAGRVIQHPRCVNCHPAGDRPMQGDDGHPHMPMVSRGEDGLGKIGMRCNSCHGPANFDPARVPGHPQWHVAPIEMAWAGKSLAEICTQLKDPKRNGGKSMAELVEHMAEDSLVGWGWTPGKGRTPAPGTQAVFGELIKAWADSGAACPS